MSFDSLQEVYLLLNITEDQQLAHWQLVSLVLHCYNLKNGLRCTGFDEDDPESDQNIIALPNNFKQENSEVVTFRYRNSTEKADLIFKVVPSADLKEIDVNAMASDNNDQIFSATIQISHLDLAGADKGKLSNIDPWACKAGTGVATEMYISDVFNKICKKEKKEEAKKDENKFAQAAQRAGPPGYQPYRGGGNGGGNPFINPRNPFAGERPQVIGDPDPLRIGGPRGGPQGNLVGPGSNLFRPHYGGPQPGFGGGVDPGFPDWQQPMDGPGSGDLHPQFPGQPGMRPRPPFGGPGGPGFGPGGGFGGTGGGFGGGGGMGGPFG